MIKAVLFVLSTIGLILISQNVMAEFLSGDFAVWEAPASLKRSIEVILRIKLKQSYCEILESVPAVFGKLSWNFRPSLSVCSSLAENRQYITCFCRYILEIWPVLMACIWKNRYLFAAFWDKISLFHLRQTEHVSARGDGPLCAQHLPLISFIWCRAT